MYNRVSSNRSDQLKSTLLNNSIVFTLHTKSTPLGPSKKMHHSSTPAIQNQKKSKDKSPISILKKRKKKPKPHQLLPLSSYKPKYSKQWSKPKEERLEKKQTKHHTASNLSYSMSWEKQAHDTVQRLCQFCTKVLTDGSCLALWSINTSFPVASAILT